MSEYSIPEKQTLVFPLFGQKPESLEPIFLHSPLLCYLCACVGSVLTWTQRHCVHW